MYRALNLLINENIMTIRLLYWSLNWKHEICIFVLKFNVCISRGTILFFLYTCSSKDKTDMDVIKENHKFLWDDEEADTW